MGHLKGVTFALLLILVHDVELKNLTCYSCVTDTDSLCAKNEICEIPPEMYKETLCVKLVVDHTHGKEKVHRSCETEKLQDDLCLIKKEMLEREQLEMISCSVCGIPYCNIGCITKVFNHIILLCLVTVMFRT
ncbi:uncharacterized protein LOC106661026 [Cimex lectularius]|uniref:Protein sleepless n=1 Tax=Cimex lectularius TaxID=79782 RepID=A0A8I6R741_CIMLE|nr:uncharacterized protein LOC106661026 [Cimex lectularius]